MNSVPLVSGVHQGENIDFKRNYEMEIISMVYEIGEHTDDIWKSVTAQICMLGVIVKRLRKLGKELLYEIKLRKQLF